MWIRGDAIITAEGGARRVASVYGSPNNVGLILGRCIPFALAMTLIKVNQKRKIIAGVILLVMTITVVLTQSAGAIFVGNYTPDIGDDTDPSIHRVQPWPQ